MAIEETLDQLKEYQKMMNISIKISSAAQEVADVFDTLMDEITKKVPSWAWECVLQEATEEELNLYLLDSSLEQ